MPKRIAINPHLSVKELENRYRAAKNPVERSHYQIVWLLAQGKTTEEVAAVTGYCRDWIRKLVRRYNNQGAAGLADRRCEYPGAPPLLDDLQQAYLWQALQSPPQDGGLWNSRKVAQWIAEVIGRPVDIQRGWDYLRQMDLRLKCPRPVHQEADPFEQEAWKKKLAQKVAQVRQEHPNRVVKTAGINSPYYLLSLVAAYCCLIGHSPQSHLVHLSIGDDYHYREGPSDGSFSINLSISSRKL